MGLYGYFVVLPKKIKIYGLMPYIPLPFIYSTYRVDQTSKKGNELIAASPT